MATNTLDKKPVLTAKIVDLEKELKVVNQLYDKNGNTITEVVRGAYAGCKKCHADGNEGKNKVNVYYLAPLLNALDDPKKFEKVKPYLTIYSCGDHYCQLLDDLIAGTWKQTQHDEKSGMNKEYKVYLPSIIVSVDCGDMETAFSNGMDKNLSQKCLSVAHALNLVYLAGNRNQ